MGKQQEFWDALASQWSEHNKDVLVGWYDQHNAFDDYETVLWDGIEREGKTALEYGCGPGRNLIRFHSKFAQIDGVDHAAAIVEKGRHHVAAALGEVPNMPRLFHNDGESLKGIADKSYDIVFSVIALQHVNARPKRLKIKSEIFRVLKTNGAFTAQMGFGPGHPKSQDYFAAEEISDADTRVEDARDLENDLRSIGFVDFKYQIRPPNHDCHPQWIWFQARKVE